LAVLASLTILTMILPNYTLGTPGPAFSTSQLIFASVVSLVLYGSFVFIQTLRHRDYFLPLGSGEEGRGSSRLLRARAVPSSSFESNLSAEHVR
jgi:Ca2+/H+ antiporter